MGTGCTQVQETYFYNKRLQVGVGEIGTSANHSADSCRVYNYYVGVNNASACSETPSNWPSGTNNNGNAAGYYYLDNANSGLGHAATYHYDHVNRLTTAAATGNSTYSQSLTYDAYGNVDCSASPAENACLAPTYPASNQIYGYRYDAAGDVTNDGTYTYTWDAEAHLTKVVNGGGTTISTNTYNALGQRVRDVTTSATTDEAYGGDGSLLWGWTGNPSTNRSFVPFKGDILAEYYSGGTLFDHSDELGSVTTSTNYYNGGVCQERLFYPFGELWTGAGSCGMHQTFAKLPDYDAETDQYNTLNRHYTPSGRWMSPDPGGIKVVHLDDPQTWNMYAYVRNNPTTLTDPSGLGVLDNLWPRVVAGLKELVGSPSPPSALPPVRMPRSQGTQRQPKQKPPANSRQDIVLVPAGKPERYKPFQWRMDWSIMEKKGNDVESPGSKYENSVVTLNERVEGEKEWKSGGSDKGAFMDTISTESRTITQEFSVDGQRVQVVLGKDDQGNLVGTWDVNVNVTPSGPVYSPSP